MAIAEPAFQNFQRADDLLRQGDISEAQAILRELVKQEEDLNARRDAAISIVSHFLVEDLGAATAALALVVPIAAALAAAITASIMALTWKISPVRA